MTLKLQITQRSQRGHDQTLKIQYNGWLLMNAGRWFRRSSVSAAEHRSGLSELSEQRVQLALLNPFFRLRDPRIVEGHGIEVGGDVVGILE